MQYKLIAKDYQILEESLQHVRQKVKGRNLGKIDSTQGTEKNLKTIKSILNPFEELKKKAIAMK